jgi:hypothetical protein
VQPDPSLAAVLRAAISSDLELNGTIGNGNWLANLWYNAMSERKTGHIRNLICVPQQRGYRCAFTLFREGGPGTALGQTAPDTLKCEATFERDTEVNGSWRVQHLPHVGHSQTSMACDVPH